MCQKFKNYDNLYGEGTNGYKRNTNIAFSSKTVMNIVLNYEMRTRVIRYEEDLPEY